LAVAAHGIYEAKKRGVKVVLDVNYRSLLWSAELARTTIAAFFPQVDLLLCSRGDADTVFGIKELGVKAAESLQESTGIPDVVMTDGINGTYHASENHASTFDVLPTTVFDRPGAGDSLVAGVIFGYIKGNVDRGIALGTRAATYALTHFGDLTRVSLEELERPLVGGIVR